MDNGLRRVQGRKLPSTALDVDLAELARAVTSLMRGQATTQTLTNGDVRYVQITGRGINALIVHDDWARILPLIRDDVFTTQEYPVESAVRPLDTVTRLSSSTVDARDPLYARVRGELGLLFTSKVPT